MTARIFNPNASVRVEKFDDRHFCLIIDDALLEPEKLVQFAVDRRSDFSTVDYSFYPGVYLPAPRELTTSLSEFFRWGLRRHFDARRGENVSCRYSMVTLPPHALRPIQWICHRDDSNLDARLSMQACVLYLFHDQSLGGTNFYAPARPKSEIDALFVDAKLIGVDTFAAKYRIKAGYIREGNEYFRRIGSVAAKWNRLIFYDGSMLHSSDITAPESLSCDPLSGRLTLNGFFTSRRHLV
ncbi:MAG: DUF6445 family protein [Pseudomonadota bacterium]|nr:DUF6445 family protein [Pseudomonadota bacterium]